MNKEMIDIGRMLYLAHWEDLFLSEDLAMGKNENLIRNVQQVAVEEQGPDYRTIRSIVLDRGIFYRSFATVIGPPRKPKDAIFECKCTCGIDECRHVAATLAHIEKEFSNLMGRNANAGIGTSTAFVGTEMENWLAQVKRSASVDPLSKNKSNSAHRLYYGFNRAKPTEGPRCVLGLYSCRILKNGSFGKIGRADLRKVTNKQYPKYFSSEDIERVEEMLALPGVHQKDNQDTDFLPGGRSWTLLVTDILKNCQVIWNEDCNQRLTWSEEMEVLPVWKIDEEAVQYPGFEFESTKSEALVIPTDPPCYVDPDKLTCGRALWSQSFSPLLWTEAPVVPAEAAEAVVEKMRGMSKKTSKIEPKKIARQPAEYEKVIPRLVLKSLDLDEAARWPMSSFVSMVGGKSFGLLQYRYGPLVVENPVTEIAEVAKCVDGVVYTATRDFDQENEAYQFARDMGMGSPSMDVGNFYSARIPDGMENALTLTYKLTEERAWMRFLAHLSRWSEAGWEMEFDESFAYKLIHPDTFWAKLDESSGMDWMQFDYGIEIDGERVSLLEALVSYIEAASSSLDIKALQEADPAKVVPLPVPDKDNQTRLVAVPARKLGDLISAVMELLQLPRGGVGMHALAAAQAVELLPELARQTSKKLRELGKKLSNFEGIKPVKTPATLKTDLRPYQQQGLSWLQFLREFQLGGILADDMGLGKTIQTLAHILVERRSRRADRPTLIVAPTSVLGNWEAEAERFAPCLKVLPLQGVERKKRFNEIPESDIVLTSYALLSRDGDVLKKHKYHFLILDEAQYIKNPKSIMARTVCELNSRHRLCLTGTPIENHLGELWSQFHFLLPGLLGNMDLFRKHWQRPIEQGGDTEKQRLLNRRVSPLLLRRTREAVLAELPARTDMVRTTRLTKSQTGLYEAVRAAMDKRVRDAVSAKGLGRSHIVVLDALLKLRQICCHPQLLKTAAARKVKESAKLDLFNELVAGLVEDGRRILVFSQFTSMISILEKNLDKQGIEWIKLIGSTPAVKRKEAIDRFQTGEVPVFLISLKAGGSGLNLTAADTVVHYDPWWNPAVEEQAIGRAHRIGQEKPVFVYRLVTEGTIEERILALQERKAELAKLILGSGDTGDSKRGNFRLEKQDLEHLLAPIE